MHKVSAPEAAVTLLMKRFPFSSSGHRRLKSFPATDAESSREEVLSLACRAAEQFIMGLTGLATPPPLVSSLEPPLYKLIVSFILAPRPSSPSLHSRRPSPPAPTPQRHHHDQCFFSVIYRCSSGHCAVLIAVSKGRLVSLVWRGIQSCRPFGKVAMLAAQIFGR